MSTKRKILITGGRAPVALDLARALGADGHEVFVAESIPYTLASYSKYVSRTFVVPQPSASPAEFGESIRAILEDHRIDLLIPTCEEIFYLARFQDRFPAHTQVWIDSFEKLETLHNKSRFIDLCRSFGLPTPRTETYSCRSELRDRLERASEAKIVLKPAYSRFASQTHIGSPQELLKKLDSHAISQDSPWLVQECLIGQEYCTYALAENGHTLALSAYTREFTAGKGAGISFENNLPSAVETFIRAVVEKTKFTGQIAFDLMLSDRGEIHPIECNPRATSGLHLLTPDPRFIQRLVARDSVPSAAVTPGPRARAQIHLAMIVYGIAQCTRFTRFLKWVKISVSARDVIFSFRDPLPFFGQFAFYFEAFRRSQRENKTPQEVTTQDIEWNGQAL